MRAFIVNFGRGLGVALGAALVAAAPGQQPTAPLPAPLGRPSYVVTPSETRTRPAAAEREGATRMEIFNGPNRTVRYFSGGSLGEQGMLNDLERAENEMAYLKDLQALKRQYVTSERTLEPQRRYVQEELYGTSISTGWYNTATSVIPSWGGWGGWGGGGYPYAWPYNYGGYGFGGDTFGAGGSTFITRNLSNGMGDQGPMLTNVAPVIAQQLASPEYQNAVTRNYATALNHVASSDRLAKSLGLEGGGRIAEAAGRPDMATARQATLTLKDGKTIEGKMVETDDWYYVDTGKTEERIRKSDVTRVSTPK